MKFFFLLTLVFILGASCTKTSSEKTWSVLTKKGTTWHVDKMVVTSILYSSNAVEGQQEFYNVGDFIFKGESSDDDDCALEFTGQVKLHPSYNLTYGSFSAPLYVTSTEMYTNPDDIGGSTQYKISYLSKDKLKMFVPREINVFYVGPYEFNFYFECSRR